ncbi:hypothetical protein J6590_065048 [Homalodisca vitripennis]|nr:hypothetical protein J6590_065048 [Homalodisca vitripennis]
MQKNCEKKSVPSPECATFIQVWEGLISQTKSVARQVQLSFRTCRAKRVTYTSGHSRRPSRLSCSFSDYHWRSSNHRCGHSYQYEDGDTWASGALPVLAG